MNVRNDLFFNTIFKHHFHTPFVKTILNDHYFNTIFKDQHTTYV